MDEADWIDKYIRHMLAHIERACVDVSELFMTVCAV